MHTNVPPPPKPARSSGTAAASQSQIQNDNICVRGCNAAQGIASVLRLSDNLNSLDGSDERGDPLSNQGRILNQKDLQHGTGPCAFIHLSSFVHTFTTVLLALKPVDLAAQIVNQWHDRQHD